LAEIIDGTVRDDIWVFIFVFGGGDRVDGVFVAEDGSEVGADRVGVRCGFDFDGDGCSGAVKMHSWEPDIVLFRDLIEALARAGGAFECAGIPRIETRLDFKAATRRRTPKRGSDCLIRVSI
jgi:hypothetical protein